MAICLEAAILPNSAVIAKISRVSDITFRMHLILMDSVITHTLFHSSTQNGMKTVEEFENGQLVSKTVNGQAIAIEGPEKHSKRKK